MSQWDKIYVFIMRDTVTMAGSNKTMRIVRVGEGHAPAGSAVARRTPQVATTMTRTRVALLHEGLRA